MIQNIQELEVIERLDETHRGSTQIMLGKYKGNLLVCKSIEKVSLIDSKSIEHVLNQKEALKYFTDNGVNGINKLIHTFQDAAKLYIVLEPIEGLPLHKLLQMVGKLNERFVFMMVVQIGLILREVHAKGFIYRDIKASNFMVNSKGKVTLIDLGHTKKIDGSRTFTICGTAHSMPPQIYEGKGYSYQFDYYGFGILIYELLVGKAPFGYGTTNPHLKEDMQKGISQDQLTALSDINAQNLVKGLLQSSEIRLGTKGGFDVILQHQYFNIPEFMDAKDIWQNVGELDPKDADFQFIISQILDFGVDKQKYNQITPQDPFYRFFG